MDGNDKTACHKRKRDNNGGNKQSKKHKSPFDAFRDLFPNAPMATGMPPPGTNTKLTIENTVGGTFPKLPADWKPVQFDCPKADAKPMKACFGCEYGLANPSDDMPALVNLWRIFTDNYGKEMSNAQLSELMHEYWVEEIQKPMKEQGTDLPDWSAEDIQLHIEQHMIEPTVHASTSIRQLKRIAALLRDQVQIKHKKSGETKVNLKVLRSLLQVEQEIRSLYNSRCTKQLFYSQRLKLDDQRAHQI